MERDEKGSYILVNGIKCYGPYQTCVELIRYIEALELRIKELEITLKYKE